MSPQRRHKPTNGHPTRHAAIIELYEQRVPQSTIAKTLGCSRNSVSQSIFIYRKKTGRVIAPILLEKKQPAILPDIKANQASFAMRNYLKSVAGAREALEAMGA